MAECFLPPARADLGMEGEFCALRLSDGSVGMAFVLLGAHARMRDVSRARANVDVLRQQLAELDREFLEPSYVPPTREEVVLGYADYVDRMLARGHRLPLMLRHAHGLYAGLPNARSWRRFLTERGQSPGASGDVLRRSLEMFRHAA